MFKTVLLTVETDTWKEFCSGVMHIKGQARALDVLALQHACGKLLHTCQSIEGKLQTVQEVMPI